MKILLSKLRCMLFGHKKYVVYRTVGENNVVVNRCFCDRCYTAYDVVESK